MRPDSTKAGRATLMSFGNQEQDRNVLYNNFSAIQQARPSAPQFYTPSMIMNQVQTSFQNG
jgi:hypothetical protein